MAFMRNPGRGGSGRGRRGRGTSSSGPRGARGGPTLPATLMAEVDSTYGKTKRMFDNRPRKERRKAARNERRAPPYLQQHAPSHSEPDEPEDTPKASALPVRPPPSAHKEPIRKKVKILPELVLPGEEGSDVEDEEIEWLEWMLKKEKNKGKAKAVEDDIEMDDGLGDLIDLAEVIGPGGSGLPRRQGKGSEFADTTNYMESEDDEDEAKDSVGEVQGDRSEQDIDDPSEDEESVLGEASSRGFSIRGDRRASEIEKRSPLHRRTSGSSSSSAQISVPSFIPTLIRYIPPQLRAQQLEEKSRGSKEKVEERIKLERKVQGLLNKLGEANIDSILGEIEELYRERSRHDVTTTLTTLVLQTISSRSNLLDSFVVLYATLVGALHRIIGMEFGAHLVHTLVMRYTSLTTGQEPSTQLSATIYETPDASKEGLNLLVLISELYNAGVVSAELIYDLIRNFLKDNQDQEVMREGEVEGLLKILRCCGAQLRRDDPSSLKDIVALVHEKTRGKEKTMTSRARFMVETLTNVKNNKLRSISGTEQGNDAAERMQKFLSSLGRRRHLLTIEPLRVGLSDLLDAGKKGKWWLVGAGWAGDPLVDRQNEPAQKRKQQADGEDDQEDLSHIARKQGMNTDVRRSIFVVLMSSEDYMHACDRLSRLRSTAVQQREFIRVALHCAGLEKIYNPYYTLILNHLCAESHDHRFTLQYAFWDFLRTLEEGESEKAPKRKSGNIARAMAYVVGRGNLDISVFKTVEWTSLTRRTTEFLLTFVIHLILATQTPSPLFVLPNSDESCDEEVLEEVFEKALINSELTQGLMVLLSGRKTEKFMDSMSMGNRELQMVRVALEVAKRVLAQAV